jgi:tRNA-dihydrouridine synthase B
MHAGPRVGAFTLPNRVFAAPMAGVTDRPFRRLCRQLGAGHLVAEMAASNPQLWASEKTMRRLNHDGEPGPIAVQLAGSDPQMLAQAARFNVERGAQIIDINMGCPAKKVCNVAAGSALLKDEALVGRILDAVVAAVAVPVTLKIRTGWDPHQRNAVRVARIAQSAGVRALAVHGRTRACGFTGHAEYETIAAVKSRVGIPVVANGDVDGPEKAKQVLEETQADAIMIGRAAQGRPWIFREIAYYLESGQKLPPPEVSEVRRLLLDHVNELHAFYGEPSGVRLARKHVCWYTRELAGSVAFRQSMNRLETASEQMAAVDAFFAQLAERNERLTYGEEELAA